MSPDLVRTQHRPTNRRLCLRLNKQFCFLTKPFSWVLTQAVSWRCWAHRQVATTPLIFNAWMNLTEPSDFNAWMSPSLCTKITRHGEKGPLNLVCTGPKASGRGSGTWEGSYMWSIIYFELRPSRNQFQSCPLPAVSCHSIRLKIWIESHVLHGHIMLGHNHGVGDTQMRVPPRSSLVTHFC